MFSLVLHNYFHCKSYFSFVFKSISIIELNQLAAAINILNVEMTIFCQIALNVCVFRS